MEYIRVLGLIVPLAICLVTLGYAMRSIYDHIGNLQRRVNRLESYATDRSVRWNSQ